MSHTRNVPVLERRRWLWCTLGEYLATLIRTLGGVFSGLVGLGLPSFGKVEADLSKTNRCRFT